MALTERDQLKGLITRGREATYRRQHAQVLMLVDEGEYGPGLTDQVAAERIDCSRRAVEQIRECFVTEGLAAALELKKRSRERSRKLDGEGGPACQYCLQSRT